ncbi:triose-phosphate isomerase [Mesopusillimonas faecipullorum]|nr:triose-phosphate isomerase [Mesopusillimonas faecipullorum]
MGQAITRLVIGNWKMHGKLATNQALLEALAAGSMSLSGQCHLGVCVPFPYLAQAQAQLQGSALSWGAQDVSAHLGGAYTGEVAAPMLADFGAQWVLVGHSERRAMHGEDSALVASKAQAALNAGITPVVCIGETLEQHDAGHTDAVIADQLAPVLALGPQALAKMVFAYEPVWAIGTGQSATPDQAQAVHATIRERLAAFDAADRPILYGGSVKADNAAGLLSMPDINGALVGGASLLAEEFLRIAAA